jgi:hypothetical protein
MSLLIPSLLRDANGGALDPDGNRAGILKQLPRLMLLKC